ncbi:MAG: hypothetical protein GXY13_11775 [Acidimicrobiales bacterium]|nr:hypothetical protein [Acidimicrobiales bacterium]
MTAPTAVRRDLDSVPDVGPGPVATARRAWRALTRGHRGTALAAALVGLAIALPLPTLFRYQGPPMEEGFMLVFPQRVLAGDVANRDFLHLYGPGSLWALAAWFKVAGTTLAAQRTFGLFQHLGIIYGLFLLALGWGRRVALAVGLLGVLLVVTPIGLTALAWNGAVALAVAGSGLAVHGAARRTSGRPWGRALLVASGVVYGAALLFRPDLVVGAGLATVGLLWGRWRRDLIAPVLLGLVVGAAPMLVHLAMAGIGPAFEGMFLQPVFELRGGRHLPIPPSWSQLDGALAAVAQLRVPDWPLPMLSASQQVTVWFFLLPVSALLTLVTGWMAVRRDPTGARSRTLLVVGGLGLGLLPQALQRPDSTHLAWVSCVAIVFLPATFAQWSEWRGAARRPWLRTVAAALPLLLVVLLLPAYTARTWVDLTRQNLTADYFGWAVRRGDRTFYLGAPDIAASAQAVTDDLGARVQPGDRLLVGTADLRRTPYSDAYFYFLFPETVPATRYIEMDPGIADAEGSGLADEVASADWLILSHVWDSWDEPNDSRRYGSDAPNQVVRDRFCLVGEHGGHFLLYQRCR